MAIVTMKKLRLLASRAQKDALIREIMLLGCVELREQSLTLSDERLAAFLSRESGAPAELRAKKALLADSMKLLDKYAPCKAPLLSAKPEITPEEFLDESDLEKALSAAREIQGFDEKIRNCFQEEAHRSTLVEVLTPWKDFKLPLEYEGSQYVSLRLGTLPIMSDFDSLCARLTDEIGSVDIEQISSDEHTRYICVFHLRDQEAEVSEILRAYGFAAPVFSGITGLAKDNIEQCREMLHQLEMERRVCEAQISVMAKYRDILKVCYDRVNTREERADAAEMLLRTENVVCLEGWASAPEEEKLIAVMEKYDCAYEFIEPEEEEYPNVPVKLKNNFFTSGLNMVTNMYSLPQYGTVDPNPLMAPFFILFYGLMMADMGYGLLMIVAAIVAMKKMRPKAGMLNFCQLLLWGGISTFIMGALTGGFFADAPLQVVKIFNPDTTWTGLPALFDPLNDSLYVLIGALVLGFIHLNAGMVISFVQKVKHGQLVDGIFYEVSMWILFLGAILAVLGVGSISGVPVVLCVGALMLLYGGTRGKKGIGKITGVFGVLYNELTGWFGDILSYSRIMALMLAGSVVGQVFNTIGAMFGNIVIFIIVFIIGHALNFALNLLGCYVHDLRLQCLEYFGKFYVDGGKPFNPLKVNTKYVEVTKQGGTN